LGKEFKKGGALSGKKKHIYRITVGAHCGVFEIG
jgi:hypothetical protein